MKQIIYFVIITLLVCISCSTNKKNTSSKPITHYDSYLSNDLDPEDEESPSIYLTDTFHYNWYYIAIDMSMILKSSGMSEFGADTYLSTWSMFNPFEIINCKEGDTIYITTWKTLQEDYGMGLWVNNPINRLSARIYWTSIYTPKIHIKSYSNLISADDINYQDKLIMKWDINQLKREGKFEKRFFKVFDAPSTIHVFRILLKKRSRYIIDYFSYPCYTTMNKEDLEFYEWDFKENRIESHNPLDSIPPEFIH